MRIAFDFHGVLDKYPQVFKPILESLVINKHEIFILSGPPKTQIIEELEDAKYVSGIHFTGIISVVDYLKVMEVPMYQKDNGNWYCNDLDWWSSKAGICNEYCIEVMYDDKLQYKEHIKGNNPIFLHVS